MFLKLNWIGIHVADFETSLRFYTKVLGMNATDTKPDWAYIETLRGVIKMKAKVTTNIHPKIVNCEHLWWFPEQPAREPWLGGMWESNCNVLTMDDPDTCDPVTGGWTMRALLCKVYKVKTV